MTRVLLAAAVALGVATLPRAAGDEVVEKSAGGATLARYTVVGGVKDGPFTTYYPGGAAESTGRYKAGELDGVVRYTDAKGKTLATASFKAGQPDGRRTDFAPTGREVSVVVSEAGVVKSVKASDGSGLVSVPHAASDPRCPPRYGDVRRVLARIDAQPAPAGEPAEAVAALRQLQRYRAYAGVPWEGLTLDPTFTRHATDGAKLLQQLGKLTHTPDNPGWPEEEFQSAYTGTSKSNITGGAKHTLAASVDGYMDDSDPSNVDRVGHRRWCLNPAMLKTGFGKSPAGTYSAMWAFDRSRTDAPAFDYLPYPPAGVQPVGFVSTKHAWHVTFNPKRYKLPAKDAVTVRVARLGVGDMPTVGVVHVSTQGFGAGPAVIFVPAPVAIVPGARYRVTIEGVTQADGTAAVVDYVVWFAP